jgi:hypothetical protein
MNNIEIKQTKVICSNYGGNECYDCKFNHVTNGYLGQKFYCTCAMNDMSGDMVTLIEP